MQQLSFLDPPPRDGAAPVWQALDKEQRMGLVLRLVETQGEVTRGVHLPERQSLTVAEAARLWLERGDAEGLERTTQRHYAGLVKFHIVSDDSVIAQIRLSQLPSTPMLESWHDRLVVKLSRALARKVLAALKAILSEAQRRGLVAQNVATPVKIDTRKRDLRKLEIGRDVPDKAALQSLLAACIGPLARYRPFVITAIFSGMGRRSYED